MIGENEVKNPIPDTGDENLHEKNKNEEITISILNKNNTNETYGNEVYLKSD